VNRVERLLARYASGEGVRLGVVPEFPAGQLREDLKDVLRRNGVYFNVLFGLLLCMVVVVAVLLIAFIREPQVAAGILAVSGISLPFLIRLLLRMWQVKTQAETLMVLAAHLEPSVMRSIVRALSQALSPKALTVKQ
jgi:hypothetical protein